MDIKKIPMAIGRLVLVILAIFALFFAGCGKEKAVEQGSFKISDPKIQAEWDRAVAAAKSKDYVTSIEIFQNLNVAAGLTPDQQKTVKDALKATNDELIEAVKKDDPKAIEALSQLRKAHQR